MNVLSLADSQATAAPSQPTSGLPRILSLCLIARASKEMATNVRSTKNWLQILIRSLNNKQPEVKNQKGRGREKAVRACLVGVATEQIELYSTEA